MPELPIAGYPGAIQSHTEADIRENLGKTVFDQIIQGLTKPAGSQTTARDLTKSAEIVFKGTLDEVNRFFFEKKWTDGLAIIPPTVEKVDEFLKYADRPPDEEVATLPQANLRATPRNIAANAAMAGCRPESMPLLIAAVQAIGEPHFQLMSVGSTRCKTPWLLVNGPIVKGLGIEYGVGARSRGPNPALGRALGLILNNIAGFRPGEAWMGTWGYYLPFVLAEDEDTCSEIGWEPYHVEHGFPRGASTVTARTTACWGDQASPARPDARSILQMACKYQERMVTTEICLPFGEGVMVAVLITPPTAKVLANAGYSKRDVAEYLWQNTRITAGEVNWRLQGYHRTLHDIVEEGVLPKWFDVAPEETIPLIANANLIDVVVCGDAHKDKMMILWCNYLRPVTKEIRLPAGWEGAVRGA
ncbi:MAG: hypothetical protein HYX92_12295 [Chloroflexi bacterium]|nr:hypothetical protein [Chloroflexota bacterium]